MLSEIEKKRLIVEKWLSDPVARHYDFSDKVLWKKQIDILWSVRNNKRTVVKSGNTIGKSFISADVAMDWLSTRYPSRVVTTAPTFSQVEGILWKEIRNYCNKSKIPIGGSLLSTELKFNDEHFAEGISTNDVSRFQGRHSPHLLVILDEASGVMKDIWETVEALHPESILAIGNPIEPTGDFAEAFQSDRWNKITVSCYDAVEWQEKNKVIPGLVTREWCTDMADLHGIRSSWYRVHVLGEFPEQDESALIERQWVDRSRKGIDSDGLEMDEDVERDAYKVIGWDVATKHGSCESVLGYRYGHTIPLLKGYLRQTNTFMRDEVEAMYTDKRCRRVCVDADGVGESMADLLSEVRIPCLEFHGGYGSKAIDQTKFKNLRTQFYWVVAKKFEKGLYNLKYMPEDQFQMLRMQLCSIRQKPDDALGRMQIETKEDLLSRQIKSPDYSDCFMLMEYCSYMRKMEEVGPVRYGRL